MNSEHLTYSISEKKDSITCNLCGRTSYNGGDITARFCGHCKYWHNEPHFEKLPPATYEKLLKLRYPLIEWRKPIVVATADLSRYVCRICIANHGLKSEDVKNWPETRTAFDEHLKQTHPDEN